MKLSSTINETSFAVCYADATSLVLDAVALTGTARREKLTFALGRLEKAYLWADTEPEMILATGLTQIIRDLERKGMDA